MTDSLGSVERRIDALERDDGQEWPEILIWRDDDDGDEQLRQKAEPKVRAVGWLGDALQYENLTIVSWLRENEQTGDWLGFDNEA